MGCLLIYGKGAIEHGVFENVTPAAATVILGSTPSHICHDMGCLSPFRANASWFSLRGFLRL